MILDWLMFEIFASTNARNVAFGFWRIKLERISSRLSLHFAHSESYSKEIKFVVIVEESSAEDDGGGDGRESGKIPGKSIKSKEGTYGEW